MQTNYHYINNLLQNFRVRKKVYTSFHKNQIINFYIFLNRKRIQKKMIWTFYAIKYNMQCNGLRKESDSKTSTKYNIISEKW